jgi:uncharacterized protein YjiS (DUF1127 family)
MATLRLRANHHGIRLHQKNWGAALTQGWCRWRLRWARHGQRRLLRDLADDPHRLSDLGLTRQQALNQADKPFWR